MDNADSELILFNASWMDSTVLDCLKDEIKEATDTALGENTESEEFLGEDPEYN